MYFAHLDPGQKGGKTKRKRIYQEFLELAEIISQIFTEELQRLDPKLETIKVKPSQHEKLCRLFVWIKEDLDELFRLIETCTERTQEDEPPTSCQD